MESKSFVKFMFSGFLIFSIAVLLITTKMSPEQGSTVILTLIFSTFISVFCLISMIGYLLRRKMSNNEAIYRNRKISMRQGVLVGLLIVSILTLGWFDLLVWWDVTIIATALIGLDIYFGSVIKRSENRPRRY